MWLVGGHACTQGIMGMGQDKWYVVAYLLGFGAMCWGTMHNIHASSSIHFFSLYNVQIT